MGDKGSFMNQQARCSECGSALAAGSPAGLCARCLFKRGLESNTYNSMENPTEARSAWTPPTPAELSGRFEELEVQELVGRGGMGAVYKVRQKNLDRLAALKILPPEFGASAEFKERFAREAQAMAKLSHPHIVPIFDYGQRGDLCYFIMEYMDGLNLRQLMASGNVSPKEALAIVPQICEALQYAHDQGIVHRDIKPENILLNKQGEVKIADFGLAKLIGRGAEGEKIVGTPKYMAPEQMSKPAEVDHRADIYSLGVVFYQMLTGQLPAKEIELPSRKVQIDVRLDEIVLRALEKEPQMRFQNATQFRTEVETVIGAGRMAFDESAMRPEDPSRQYWFKAKKYGWGWGLPSSWQGWVFILIWAPVAIVSTTWVGNHNLPLAFVILNIMVALLLIVCFTKGEPPRWRWGEKDNQDPTPRKPRGTNTTPGIMNYSAIPVKTGFSKTALFGAIWAALFFLVVPAFLVHEYQTHEFWRNGPISGKLGLDLISLLVILPSMLAPFGVTILGSIAISQIRRSAGQIYGLGMALFDALLFPLMLLDGAILFGFMGVSKMLLSASTTTSAGGGTVTMTPGGGLPVGLGLILCIVVDWIIVKRTWRSVNRPLVDETSSAAIQTLPQKTSRLAIATFVIVLIALSWIALDQMLPKRPTATTPATQTAASIEAALVGRWEVIGVDGNDKSTIGAILELTGDHRYSGIESDKGKIIKSAGTWSIVGQGVLRIVEEQHPNQDAHFAIDLQVEISGDKMTLSQLQENKIIHLKRLPNAKAGEPTEPTLLLQNRVESDLQTLRGQLELYKIQHQDHHPTLAQLQNAWSVLTTRTDGDGNIKTDGQYGPYMMGQPINPIMRLGFVAPAGKAWSNAGWTYDEKAFLLRAVVTEDLYLPSMSPEDFEKIRPEVEREMKDLEAKSKKADDLISRFNGVAASFWLGHEKTFPTLEQLAPDWKLFLNKSDSKGNISDDGKLGPYLNAAPANPFTGKTTLASHEKPVEEAGWTYDEKTHLFRLVAPAGLELGSLREDQVERIK